MSVIPKRVFLGGTHQLKFGTTDDWENAGTRILENKVAGNYELQFNRGVPSQIVVYNYPFATSINDLHSQALYATDVMAIGRVTLNFGVRWERYHNFYPEQTREAGQFSAIFPEKTYPKQDVLTWIDTVPRAGAAWDVMGDGKTVIKGSFGLFGESMGDLYANAFNPNAAATNTYAWNGPCVTTEFRNNTFNNTSCDVSSDFLASLPSRTPINATGGLNSVINPDLAQNKTYEYTARLERQLIPNVAVSGGYVYHKVDNLYANLQYLRPYETWIPATPATPFLDHLGNPVTIYTFPASQVGSTFNVLRAANALEGRSNTFHSFEVAATKRFSRKWTGSTSFWTTKNHQWIGAGNNPQSPNDDRFPLIQTWDWEARANVTYHLPWGLFTSGSYRAQSGGAGQRTQQFTSPALRQGSVTLRMGEFGELRSPSIQIVNIKVAKNVALGGSRKLELTFQVFNALNSSGITAANYLTGPQFGQVTDITSARVARIGAGFSF